MSRKTRKLIWSAPLVAVLAVAGALALFVALAPNQAAAQDQVMVPGPVTDLDAEVKSRSEIRLTWDAPSSTSGGTPTGYRVDHSSDNRVWTLLEDNTDSTANHFMVPATATTEKYYRVFAINQAGTGPVSVDPVTAFASVPVAFPPTAPGRVKLTLTLDADDPYGKIIINWTEPTNNGSPITHYKIVEMINEDRDGDSARVECGVATQIIEGEDGSPAAIDLVPFEGDPDSEDNTELPAGDQYCLLIGIQDVDDPRMAMHAGLTGGESHYYRVIAFNDSEDPEGAPSDTRGITTRTPRNPAVPTEPVAVPVASDDAASANQAIELYWLHPTSTGGHPLGDFQVQVQLQVFELEDGALTSTLGASSEWTSLNDADGTYAANVTITADDGTANGNPVPLAINSDPMPPADPIETDSDGMITSVVGDPWNLRITGAEDGQYKFRIKSKQSGDADRGLDLESSWVSFNRPSRAGRGYINYPVENIHGTEIPLEPTLMAKALDAEVVKDQGIGLTWDPDSTVREDFDHDGEVGTDPIDVTPPVPSDYRVDVSKDDGMTWTKGQTRTISLRKWDHEGLGSGDTRFYRLFPINHGQFGEAAIAGAQAKKAVIASPDQVLNLEQTGATTTSITMSWDSIDAADKYAFYSAEPGENDARPGNDEWGDSTDVEETTYTDDKNLNPGDTRWYRVVPLSDDGDPVQGADGAEALGTASDAGEPGVPIGLVAQEAFDSNLTDSNDRGVLLLWDEPLDEGKDPHTSYTVQWKSDTMTDDAWETLVTDTENLEDQTPLSTHYHHEEPELAIDEQRAYRVAALSGSAVGVWSNVSYYPAMAYTPPQPLGNAVIGTAASDAAGSVTVNLTPGANADYHWAYYLKQGDATGMFATAAMGDATSVTITGLDSGANYAITVLSAQYPEGADAEYGMWSEWRWVSVQ